MMMATSKILAMSLQFDLPFKNFDDAEEKI